jgi:hypothetical protein
MPPEHPLGMVAVAICEEFPAMLFDRREEAHCGTKSAPVMVAVDVCVMLWRLPSLKDILVVVSMVMLHPEEPEFPLP